MYMTHSSLNDLTDCMEWDGRNGWDAIGWDGMGWEEIGLWQFLRADCNNIMWLWIDRYG